MSFFSDVYDVVMVPAERWLPALALPRRDRTFNEGVVGLGCCLNRRTPEPVGNAGLEVGDEDRRMGGAGVLIDSRNPT